ncbi:ABC transporter permease [Bifidobacterium castoris]|uniref:ABC transporter permease n=1 Tax=Bifidobacterium castoris TaxID=2306972 RepID=A0A430F4Q9_9BIFI|nr:ABC transporter permease [Bifidobacterium castoris]RSX45164.1 ABC transporter permease [Bifidobacterium castoris]
MESYFDISIWGLVASVVMVLVAAGISALMRTGVAKSLIWATARSLVQLLAMGFILEYVIRQNNVWLVIGLITLMLLAAVQITMGRATGAPKGLVGIVLLSLVVTMLLMLAIVAELIVRPKPWYAPQLVIPLTGMLLGNTVSALALGLSRFFESMRERYAEVNTMLALGATKWEAAKPSMISSIRLGLLPSIAMLASSGIVTIPGMMSGQIIAGKSPVSAAKYQFVILAAVAALTLVADSIIIALIYRRCFISYDRYFVPEPAKKLSFKDLVQLRKDVHPNEKSDEVRRAAAQEQRARTR